MQPVKIFQLTLLCILGSIAMIANSYAQSITPMAKVNGVVIPNSRLELLMKGLISQGQADTPETRKAVREDLIKQELLAQEALKKGLDKTADTSMQLEFSRQSVLIKALQNDFINTRKITDEDMRKEYETVKMQLLGEQDYNMRHILVGSEAEATDIIARIKKGSKFDQIAKDKSLDNGSKAKGGELGWAPARALLQSFPEAVTKMKKGQLTESPVQTPSGWHVIRIDDIRPAKVPAFEEVKQNIQQSIVQRLFMSYLEDLKAKAKIE